MRVYLDSCSLQRPLDSKTQTRITLEAEAVLGILALLESDQVELVSSEILLFEVDRTPSTTRREYALEVLSRARTFVTLNMRVEKRARRFEALGIRPLDALHLASAEHAKADCFCTCDDKLLRRARAISDLTTRVLLPIELIKELEQW